MEESKLRRLEQMLDLVDKDFVTQDEMAEVLEVLTTTFSSKDKELDSQLRDLKGLIDSNKKELTADLNEESGVIRAQLSLLRESITKIKAQKGEPGHTPTKIELEAIINPLIPAPIPGKDADEEKIVKKLEKDLPKFGEEFRDGLELLKGDERLDKSAIKGLGKYEVNSKELEILKQQTSFLINRPFENDAYIIGNGSPRKITVSATPPVDPSINDLWYDIS